MLDNLTKPKSLQIVKCYQPESNWSSHIDTNADMEREIFESSEFEKSVSELIISINMWLKSHDNEPMSDGTVRYPIQNSNSQNSNISVHLDYQDKKFRFFPAILYNFSHFGKFLIVQSIRKLVSLQLINFLILKLL